MSKFIEYLDETVNELKKEEGEHINTSRKDEYIRQLTRLPENWKMSLEKAKEHGDAQKVVIEETKLEMLQIIRTKFEELGA